MRKILAKAVAVELLENLPEGCYKVHSCFKHGFNLCLDHKKKEELLCQNILCFIGNKKEQQSAYGILINQRVLPRLMELISPHTEFYWDQEQKEFLGENLTISLENAIRYSSRLDKKQIESDQLLEVLNHIDGQLQTGFELTIKDFLLAYQNEIEDLYQVFQSDDSDKIQIVLKKWIGRGQGLTPSGDDMLTGILFVNQIFPIVAMEFKNNLRQLIDQGYTTDISKHYYYCAANNYFSQALLSLSQAIEEKNHKLMDTSITKVLEFGSTSGCDTLLGIIVGIRFIGRDLKF